MPRGTTSDSSAPASSSSSTACPSTQSANQSAPSALSLLLSNFGPFKCPDPNCNKSFLRANGLKYHLAHGSCKITPSKDEEAEQRPSLVGTFFQSASNVRIPGAAHFTNARDVITINYHQPTTGYPEQSPQGPGEGRTRTSSSDMNVNSQSSLSTPTSPEIYTRQLAIKGRGYPLWVPEPNNKLPVDYQKKGIGIGDVGIITPYGAFDFLFNILIPAEDPINPPEMPEDFTPLSPPINIRDVRGYAAFKSASHLSSANVKTSQSERGSLSFVTNEATPFTSSASEGAILTMPNGSTTEELTNVRNFRKYASANAVNWYRYLKLVRGYEAENGDLHLVVGYDKATAWGMATFHGSSRENEFLLEFKPVDENSFGRTYGWDYSGLAEVKSGPDLNEMEKLRILDNADHPVAYENQCLFVQTITITLQNRVWKGFVTELEELDLLDGENSPGNPDRGSSQHFSSNPDNPTGGLGRRQRTSGGPSDDMGASAGSTDAGRGSQSIRFSSSPQPPNPHPSKKINELLLKNDPTSSIALTDDNDWMSVIEEDDTVLPPPEVLYSRIVAKYQICKADGMVFILSNRGQLPERAALMTNFELDRQVAATLTLPPPTKSTFSTKKDPSSVPSGATSSGAATKTSRATTAHRKIGSLKRPRSTGSSESLESDVPPTRERNEGFTLYGNRFTLHGDPTRDEGHSNA